MLSENKVAAAMVALVDDVLNRGSSRTGIEFDMETRLGSGHLHLDPSVRASFREAAELRHASMVASLLEDFAKVRAFEARDDVPEPGPWLIRTRIVQDEMLTTGRFVSVRWLCRRVGSAPEAAVVNAHSGFEENPWRVRGVLIMDEHSMIPPEMTARIGRVVGFRAPYDGVSGWRLADVSLTELEKVHSGLRLLWPEVFESAEPSAGPVVALASSRAGDVADSVEGGV